MKLKTSVQGAAAGLYLLMFLSYSYFNTGRKRDRGRMEEGRRKLDGGGTEEVGWRR